MTNPTQGEGGDPSARSGLRGPAGRKSYSASFGTSEGLLETCRMMLEAMEVKVTHLSIETNPECDRPCIVVEAFTIWQAEPTEEYPHGAWRVDAAYQTGGSYYEPPDVDISDLYCGPTPYEALETFLVALMKERLVGYFQSLPFDEPEIGLDDPWPDCFEAPQAPAERSEAVPPSHPVPPSPTPETP